METKNENKEVVKMPRPDLPFSTLWNLSFGFFGVQIAYALQSANISRILLSGRLGLSA